MATVRNRSRSTPGEPWNYTINGTIYGSGVNPTYLVEECEDVVGDYGNPHNFDHVKTIYDGNRVSGAGLWIGYDVTATNYPGPSTALPNFLAGDSVNTIFSWLIARSNPARTELNLPVSILELRELPSMIRQAGRVMKRKNVLRRFNFDDTVGNFAAMNLAIQFGWAPIVNDLLSLVLLTESVERRKKELNRLRSGNGLRRKLKLGKYEQESTINGTFFNNTFMGSYSGSRVLKSTVRQWGTITWKPSSILPLKPFPDDFSIFRELTGFTLEATAENIWEALPWSWLIDYFTNLGDLVSATNNRHNAVYSNVCIMQEFVRSVKGSSGSTSKGFSYAGQDHVQTQQYRTAVSGVPYPEANFPLLSGRQMSILGSLAILRFL